MMPKVATAAAKPNADAEATPEPEKSVGLLDPAAFWESGGGAAAPEPEDLARGGQAAEEELSGEAVVVSAPIGRPQELFLPESERIAVTPKPTSGIKSSPAPPVPQKDFLKVGQTRKIGYQTAGIAAGICLLVGIAVWSFSGNGNEQVTQDASLAGPDPVGTKKSEPKLTAESRPIARKEPKPPLPSGAGTLKVDSDPSGALVYINDERKGVTPLTIKSVATGTEMILRIELEDHRPWTQTIVLDSTNPVREFNAGLLKEKVCEFGTGWIYVTTVPEGATVEIDGKRLPGKTPKIINDVCAGVEHEIRVQASGFRTWRKMLSVRPQKVFNLDVELER